MKRLIIIIILLMLVGGGAYVLKRQSSTQSERFRTASVERGDLVVTIDATGTVEPEEVIDVGAQVAGQILSFGKDVDGKTVDYGSVVEEVTVLAKIDDSLYVAQATEATARCQSAKANLQRAEAELEQLKAKRYQGERDWQRAQELGPSGALAESAYDAYKSAYEVANANVAVGEAAILQAKASLAEEEATLQRAERNLGYCTISSPVKGVVIDRRVNIGQTVVASLNAPSLFLIAKDLTRIQVWVAVNEAYIGKIHSGQRVVFTVDAFPGEQFQGTVGKVRLNASMTQNVVTYTVEVITDNSNGRLLPYLTANVQFEQTRLSGALLVPNAALRWKPSAEQVAPELEAGSTGPQGEQPQFGPTSRTTPETASVPDEVSHRGVVWVVEGEHVHPLSVRVLLTDGTVTAVEGEGLAEGLEVVTGVESREVTKSEPTETTNPFTPKLPRRGRSGPPSGPPPV